MAENGKGNPAKLVRCELGFSRCLPCFSPSGRATRRNVSRSASLPAPFPRSRIERIADRIFTVAGSCAEILVMPSNRITR